MEHRQPLPDLLKGIAVLAMIQVHVMEQFARPEILLSDFGKVSLFIGGPFAAPVFMAVMGYFIGAGRQGGRDTAKKNFLKNFNRGFGLILLGFLLNIGLNFNLLFHILQGSIEADPFRYIFGADILPLAGLSLIFIGVMEWVPGRKAILAMVLALSIAAVSPVLTRLPLQLEYVRAFFTGPAEWSYFPVFPWMAYALTGYAWQRFGIEYPQLHFTIKGKTRWVLLGALPVLIGFTWFAFRSITNLPDYYHHGVLLFLWILVFLIAWVQAGYALLNIAIDSQIIKWIRWLGEHVTAVYIIQWLIIGNLAFYFSQSQHIIQLVLWFAGILFVTSLITYLYLKWKRSWFLA